MDRRWVALIVLFLARTAMGYQFQSVASVGPFLADSLAINFTEVGLLIGAYFLPGTLISLPGGVFIQRFGDETICTVGLCLMVVGGMLLGTSHDFAIAFAGRLISGMGAILFNQVITKMTTDWFAGREIVFAMGVVLASWPFGVAAGLLTQSWLAGSFGWPVVMHLAAALCAIALLVMLVAYRSPPSAKSADDAAAPSAAAASRFGLPPREQILPMVVAGMIWGKANLGLVLFFSFAPRLLLGFGYAPVTAASWPSIALWAIMLSVPLGGYLIERDGRSDLAIILCSALTGLILALLALGIAPPVLCVTFGAIMGLPAGASMSLPARLLTPESRAAGLGLFFTSYYTILAFGPTMAGWLEDRWHSPIAPIMLAAALFLTIPLLLILFQRLSGSSAVTITVRR
jgi:predicted MFS family arabinose efflux permease